MEHVQGYTREGRVSHAEANAVFDEQGRNRLIHPFYTEKQNKLAAPPKFMPEGIYHPEAADEKQHIWIEIKRIIREKIAKGELKSDPRSIQEERKKLEKMPLQELKSLPKPGGGELASPPSWTQGGAIDSLKRTIMESMTHDDEVIDFLDKYNQEHGLKDGNPVETAVWDWWSNERIPQLYYYGGGRKP
jgi:hypothetical protein